jgi:hypothetical protein
VRARGFRRDRFRHFRRRQSKGDGVKTCRSGRFMSFKYYGAIGNNLGLVLKEERGFILNQPVGELTPRIPERKRAALEGWPLLIASPNEVMLRLYRA